MESASRSDASNKNYRTDTGSSLPEINLREIYLMLRRRMQIIIGATGFVTGLAILFLIFATPRYTADAKLQIDTRSGNIVDIENVVSGLSGDEASVRSEIDIITSRKLLGQVVDKLGLMEDEEFNSAKGEPGLVGGTVKWLKSMLGNEPDEEEKLRRERVAVLDKVEQSLYVAATPRSYTINIKFESKNPKTAAAVVNSLAEEYLLSQLETKFEATKRANEWLNERIADLREKVTASERAVQQFREENDLIETKSGTVTDQQLSEINTQLILTRAERAQAEARLRSVRDGITKGGGAASETISEVLESPLIQKLREQETELLRKSGELANRYGSRHPSMIAIRTEHDDLRRKIRNEIEKIAVSLGKEVEIIRSREQSLEANLASLRQNLKESDRAEVQIADLVREMQANQTLYESFLQRFKETSESQNLEKSDARVISPAEIPIRPSFPKKLVVLVLAVMVGGAIGVGLAIVAEHLDNGFKSADQVEKALGIAAIGMVPIVKNVKRGAVTDYIVTKLMSPFAEALRSVRTAVHFSNPDNPPKVLTVTSSVPQEGKSTFSLSMARLAAISGQKVLLVDCDLRRPAIAKMLGKNAEYSIGDILTGKIDESAAICTDEATGLHYIPAHSNTPNSQELLASRKMREFIARMSEKYDLIILDTPPVMAVADSVTLSAITDSTIFVIRWDETPREVVMSSIKRLKAVNAKLAGAVLTQVNLEKHKQYSYGDSGYYYATYKEYYTA